ncbi:MAG: tripartite tricarboxylate transporter TctB family protein [Thermodesulfobacteriota bacterium]
MEEQVERQQDSKKGTMPAIDFFSSIVLMAFSVGVVLRSLQMPRPGGWSSAPGLIPLFLSACTFFMGLGLFVSSLRNNGISQLVTKWRAFSPSQSVSSTKVKRSLWIILLTAFYFFVLLGRTPFEFASFIYLASTLHIFWRKAGWLKIILISTLLPFSLSALFRLVFVVFMPGDSVFDWMVTYLH